MFLKSVFKMQTDPTFVVVVVVVAWRRNERRERHPNMLIVV